MEGEEDRSDLDHDKVEDDILPTEFTIAKVVEIIEKPEDHWRILWQKQMKSHGSVTQSPAESVRSGQSQGSLYSNMSTTTKPSLIQPMPESDPVQIFKVASASEWMSISKKVTIRFDECNSTQDTNRPELIDSVADKGHHKLLEDFEPTTILDVTAQVVI